MVVILCGHLCHMVVTMMVAYGFVEGKDFVCLIPKKKKTFMEISEVDHR